MIFYDYMNAFMHLQVQIWEVKVLSFGLLAPVLC